MARKQEEEHDPTLGPQVTAVHIGGDSILDRLVPHIKKIAVAVGVVLVILTVVFTWRWYKHSKQEDSTRALVKALDVTERPIMSAEIELPPEIAALQPPSWGSHAERSEKGLGALGGVGQARGAAALVEASLLVTGNKLDEALAIYRKHAGLKTEDGVIAREGVGVVLETQAAAAKDPAQAQKLKEDALTAFRAMQPDPKGLRRDYALYHEARVLESMQRGPEAIAALQRALTDVPDSALKAQIENRLAMLGGSPTPPAPETPPAGGAAPAPAGGTAPAAPAPAAPAAPAPTPPPAGATP